MDENTLTRLIEYNQYLELKIKERNGLCQSEDFVGRFTTKVQEDTYREAHKKFSDLFPELRAPAQESQLAEKTGLSPTQRNMTPMGGGDDHIMMDQPDNYDGL